MLSPDFSCHRLVETLSHTVEQCGTNREIAVPGIFRLYDVPRAFTRIRGSDGTFRHARSLSDLARDWIEYAYS